VARTSHELSVARTSHAHVATRPETRMPPMRHTPPSSSGLPVNDQLIMDPGAKVQPPRRASDFFDDDMHSRTPRGTSHAPPTLSTQSRKSIGGISMVSTNDVPVHGVAPLKATMNDMKDLFEEKFGMRRASRTVI